MDSTDNYVNILSYNSTGMDSVKVKWINELLETFQIDLCSIQEHFKAIKTVDQYFKKNFTNYDCYVKAAYREDLGSAGRARGGLTQLVKKSCNYFKKERVQCKSWRIQAQILHLNDYKLLWVNVYMPVDPQLQVIDEAEILSTLEEIEDIIANNNYNDACFGGDWNYDANRNTRFCRIFEEFLMKHELVSAWSKFDCSYTYQHNDMNSFSTIDHFFCTEHFLERMVMGGPIHLPDNLSNHDPIMIKLKLPEPGEKIKCKPVITTKPSWKKADDEDIQDYHDTLHDKLQKLPLPSSISCSDVLCQDPDHSHNRDSHVIELLSTIIDTSFECLPIVKSGGDKKQKTKLLPGWKENVVPARDDATFWHALWVMDGRKTKGSLHMVMKWTRAKYKYAVRAAKKEANRLEAEAMAAAAEDGNKELFVEMKKHVGSKKGSGQEFPDSLEGKVTKTDIIEKFRECYEKLYNSSDKTEEMKAVKKDIDLLIMKDIPTSIHEANKITPDIVRAATELMKAGKSDVSGDYTSDVFIHAPQVVMDQLAAIFRSYLIHGNTTKEILACSFLPLLKSNLKDPRKYDSYRAIAGASQLLKLFEYVVMILWGNQISSDSLQFGYKKSHSANQLSWMILTVAEYFNARGAAVYACSLDFSKAFDCVIFDKLFLKILNRGVPPLVVKVFIYCYQEQVGWVKFGDTTSTTFRITNGTRQGSVSSPLWFKLYLDSLLKRLRDQKLGCHILGVWYGAGVFADDVFLMAPNRFTLQRMVTVAEEYGAEHNLKFSTDPDIKKSKTKCIIFRGARRIPKPEPVVLNGKQLPWVESLDHLGVKLHESIKMDSDADRARGSYMRRADDLRAQLYWSWPSTKMKSIELLASDNFGCNLWNFQSDSAISYFKSFNVQSRLSWGLDRQTKTCLVEKYFCAEHTSLRKMVLTRYPGFVKKLLSSPCFELRFLASIVIDDSRTVTCRNINYVNSITKLDVMREPKWKIKLAKIYQSDEDPEPWRLRLLTTLLDIKMNQRFDLWKLPMNTLDDMVTSLCIS